MLVPAPGARTSVAVAPAAGATRTGSIVPSGAATWSRRVTTGAGCDASRALEHDEARVGHGGDARFAERRAELGPRDELVPHRRLVDAAVVHEEPRLAVDPALERAARERGARDDAVQREDRERPDEAAADRVVRADHRVLQHVADDEQHDQVERRELPDLPLAHESEREQQKAVSHAGADHALHHHDLGRPHGRRSSRRST
jgi:hypothetical protein